MGLLVACLALLSEAAGQIADVRVPEVPLLVSPGARVPSWEATAFRKGGHLSGPLQPRRVPPAGLPALPRISDRALRETGIRKIAGRHLTLYTDLPSEGEVGQQVDALPAIFDQAVVQWAKYFEVKAQRTDSWRVRGFLMKDREKFRSVGLIPNSIPNFRNGYSTAREIWWLDQPTEYYRRHLMLHEGTHVFMASHLGGGGPGWHMEGIAEMLGTHRIEGNQLRLGIMPCNRGEVPMLGRIKLIQDRVKANGVQPIREVMKIDNQKHLANEAYAWSWALVKFLDTHPRYQKPFRATRSRVAKGDLSKVFLRHFQATWSQLEDEWTLFAGTLVHGHEIERSAITFQPGKAMGDKPALLSVATDRGWQSTGVLLEKGETYRIEAKGRFEIHQTSKVWWSEAGGVTIRYHAGYPLGQLQGAIRPTAREAKNEGDTTWVLNPIPIGLAKSITSEQEGTLYLRVNDSPAELEENRGQLEVMIWGEEREKGEKRERGRVNRERNPS